MSPNLHTGTQPQWTQCDADSSPECLIQFCYFVLWICFSITLLKGQNYTHGWFWRGNNSIFFCLSLSSLPFLCHSFPLLVGVGPASVMVGNLVAGKRIAQAAGRDLGMIEDQDLVRKVVWTLALTLSVFNHIFKRATCMSFRSSLESSVYDQYQCSKSWWYIVRLKDFPLPV